MCKNIKEFESKHKLSGYGSKFYHNNNTNYIDDAYLEYTICKFIPNDIDGLKYCDFQEASNNIHNQLLKEGWSFNKMGFTNWEPIDVFLSTFITILTTVVEKETSINN